MTKTSAIKNSGFIKTAVLSVLNIVLSVFKPLSDISENSLTSNFIKNIPSQTNKTICQCTFNGIEDIINICEYTFRLEDVNEKLLFLFGIMALIFAYKKIIEKFITAKNKSFSEKANKEICAFLADNLFLTIICFIFIQIEPQIYAALPKSIFVSILLTVIIMILFYLAFPVIIYLMCYAIMAIVFMGILIAVNIHSEITPLVYAIISITAGIAIDYIASKIMFAFAKNSIRLK